MLVCTSVSPAHPQGALAFADVARERRPQPDELEAEALLVEAAAAALGGGSIVREGPTATWSVGPRRTENGKTDGDVALELELPVLSNRGAREALAGELGQTGDLMRSGVRSVALADLAVAYARSWLAQNELLLRHEDLALAERWLQATRIRVEAGADPPYELILVAGERDRAAVDVAETTREVELAWGELARLANVGREPRPLDLASLPGTSAEPRVAEARAEAAAAVEGIAARRQLALLLARARAAGASSRWAVAGDLEREGEERVARLGLAYRFPLGGERAVLSEVLRAEELEATTEAASGEADIRARVAAASAALASSTPTVSAGDHGTARRALDARLAEGSDRASAVLPLRRQLLEAGLSALEARALRAQSAAELHLLAGGEVP
jgi:hypothetical protein